MVNQEEQNRLLICVKSVFLWKFWDYKVAVYSATSFESRWISGHISRNYREGKVEKVGFLRFWWNIIEKDTGVLSVLSADFTDHPDFLIKHFVPVYNIPENNHVQFWGVLISPLSIPVTTYNFAFCASSCILHETTIYLFLVSWLFCSLIAW